MSDLEIEGELEKLLAEVEGLFGLIKNDESIPAFGSSYQSWFTRAVKLVELLGPDRLVEFTGYYRLDPKRKKFNPESFVLQDYVMGLLPRSDRSGKSLWDIHNAARLRLLNQSQIVAALRSRLSGVLADVRGHLRAEIEEEELEVARKLIPVSLRGAGAVAGVVLEGHLQRVALNRKVPIKKKNPTISDLNDALRGAGVYDLPVWRKVLHLADLRNLCDHKRGREPAKSEIEELLIGVNSLVRTLH